VAPDQGLPGDGRQRLGLAVAAEQLRGTGWHACQCLSSETTLKKSLSMFRGPYYS
jgi:hypothetical protein